MTFIVGIDPGFSGALAFLDTTSMALTMFDMPIAPSAKGRKELELYKLVELLDPSQYGHSASRCFSILERVSPRPGEGAVSSFRFGQGFGAIEMALAGHAWERKYAAPTTWKKHFGLSSDKGTSRSLACQRFPHNASFFARVKDDGRAEAALLALYAQEVLLK